MTAPLAPSPRASSLLHNRLLGLALLAAAVPMFWAGDAHADGAFPNALSILTPAQLPNETLLATNFGLVMSFDHDQTWIWSCEQPQNSFATLYQMGPPPLNRIYAVSPTSLITTDDSSCSWNVSASGAVDAFVDPTNGNRVLAVVAKSADAGSIYTVVESADAGTTFPQLRYTAAAGDHITGVEIARSDPQTIYLTLTSGAAYTPKVAVTSNGGTSWTLHDLSTTLPAGTYSIRLVAVDPTNPGKLILRVGSGTGEALAISTNSGVSATTPLSFPGGVFTAFARMPSGSLIAGGVVGTTNVGYRSTDGGLSFPQLPAVPFTFKAMSARGTTLYAALDNMTDAFAIETSGDEGTTWRPLMRFNKDVDGGATGSIQAIQTCVMSYCQPDCDTRSNADTPLPGRLPGDRHAESDRRGRLGRIAGHGCRRRDRQGRRERFRWRDRRENDLRRRVPGRAGRHDVQQRLWPLRPRARADGWVALLDRAPRHGGLSRPPATAPLKYEGVPRPTLLRAAFLASVGLWLAGPGRARAAGACTAADARIVVETAAHRLVLCEREREVGAFSVRLGRGGVGKTAEGDGKTPLGSYPLGEPRKSDRYGTFIPIGYPTPDQRRRGFTGGDVGVHGPHRWVRWLGSLVNSFDSSHGCVGLATDGEMATIAAWVRAAHAGTIELR